MSLQLADSGSDIEAVKKGLKVQKRVLVALMIRILMTKYGRHNIGFLWIVLEPMILCCGVLIVRSMIQSSVENGVPLIGMLITGYLPLTLWRHLSGAGTFLLRRNGSMLYHRDISLFDCAAALIILEIGGCTIAFLVVYWSLLTLGLVKPVYDWGLLASGWLTMAFLSSGLMMVFAVLTEYYEAAERFVQPFQYIILPLCGFFFMVAWLPLPVQKLAWYVPPVHCYEMVRAGFFGPSVVTTYYTPWYPWVCGLVMFAYALPMVDKAREKIHFG